jgi:hypothetical protein
MLDTVRDIFSILIILASLIATLAVFDEAFGFSKARKSKKVQNEYLEKKKIHDDDLATNPKRRHYDAIDSLARHAWSSISRQQAILRDFDYYSNELHQRSNFLNLRLINNIKSKSDMERYFSSLDSSIRIRVNFNSLQAEHGSRSFVLLKISECAENFDLRSSIDKLKLEVANDANLNKLQKDEILNKIDAEFHRHLAADADIVVRRDFIISQHDKEILSHQNKMKRHRKIIDRLWGPYSYVKVDRTSLNIPVELTAYAFVVRSTKFEQFEQFDNKLKRFYIYGSGDFFDEAVVNLKDRMKILKIKSKLKRINPLDDPESV